jgi:hypothetical protein
VRERNVRRHKAGTMKLKQFIVAVIASCVLAVSATAVEPQKGNEKPPPPKEGQKVPNPPKETPPPRDKNNNSGNKGNNDGKRGGKP